MKLQKQIDNFLKAHNQSGVVVLGNIDKLKEHCTIADIYTSIFDTIELVLGGKKCKFSKNELLFVNITNPQKEEEIDNLLGINEFPSILIIENSQLIEAIPYLITKK